MGFVRRWPSPTRNRWAPSPRASAAASSGVRPGMRCSPIFMGTIERTSALGRDVKREAKGPRRNVLETDLRRIIEALATDAPLEARHRDHALTGNWKDYRDCHVKPDLVLIYRLIDDDRLILARLGSHSPPDLLADGLPPIWRDRKGVG